MIQFDSTAAMVNSTLVQEAVKEVVEGTVAGLRENRDDILAEKKDLQKRLRAYGEVDADTALSLAQNERTGAAAQVKYEDSVKRDADTAVAKAEAKSAALLTGLRTALIDGAALAELAKVAKAPGLLLPHVVKQMALEENGDGFTPVIIDAAGKPRLSPNAATLEQRMTLSELLAEMREQDEYALAFRPVDGSGSGIERTARIAEQDVTKTISQSDPNYAELFLEHHKGIKDGTVKVTD